jgi:hypothetical protein
MKRCSLFAWWLVVLTVGLLPSVAAAQDLAVSGWSFEADEWIARDAPLEVTLGRLPDASEGRIAMFLGHVDLTGRLETEGARLLYRPGSSGPPFDGGPAELGLFLVTPDGEWKILASRPVRVLYEGGFKEAQIEPRLDVSVEAQLTEHHSDDRGSPLRNKFLRTTLGAGLRTRHVLADDTIIRTNGSVVASNFQEGALRFETEGKSAPRIDLADYLVELERGDGLLQLGHFEFGDHRHLLDRVPTRGVRLGLQLHDRVDVEVGAFSGNRPVGFDNLAGVDQRDNRIYAGRLGIDLVRREDSSLRLEATWLSGRVSTREDFNEASLRDVESSHAWGFRLLGDGLSGRVRTDLSFARSTFDNPRDDRLRLLGIPNVETDTVTQNARYGEAAIDLLRSYPLTATRPVTWTVFASHEQIDPQFKSLGAFTFSDTRTNLIGTYLEVGGVSLFAQKSFTTDNLDNLDNLLKTKRRDTRVSVILPLATLIGGYDRPWPWLPTVTWDFDRVHDLADNFPVGAGFSDPTQLPDQVTIRHDTGLTWNFARGAVDYRYSTIDQDFRVLAWNPFFLVFDQGAFRECVAVDRSLCPALDPALRATAERARDLSEKVHSLAFSLEPHEQIFIGGGVSWARGESRRARSDGSLGHLEHRTLSVDLAIDWNFRPEWTLSTSGLWLRDTDSRDLAKLRSTVFDVQLARQFTWEVAGQRFPARVFARLNWSSTRLDDAFQAVRSRPAQWALVIGFNLSLF